MKKLNSISIKDLAGYPRLASFLRVNTGARWAISEFPARRSPAMWEAYKPMGIAVSKDKEPLKITEVEIARTAKFLTERYQERAESLAWSRIADLAERGDRDAAAIWELILVEIRKLAEPPNQ